jgi:hypothetical protein
VQPELSFKPVRMDCLNWYLNRDIDRPLSIKKNIDARLRYEGVDVQLQTLFFNLLVLRAFFSENYWRTFRQECVPKSAIFKG